jgi:FhuF 2Fe-2S C-terminal domain
VTADRPAPNPYFVLDPPPGDRTGWHTITELISDSDLLRAKVTATATALGTDDLRVAASVDHLGTTARIISPVLAHAAARQTIPLVGPDRMWWRPARPGPMDLAADLTPGSPATPTAVLDGVVRPVLEPLLHAYASGFHVSSRVLHGNVASALNGARRAIGSAALDDLVRAVLGSGELSGTAAQLPPAFRRASCCLLYRLPGRGLCGDCVLTPRR